MHAIPYEITEFYKRQIQKSDHYDQLKHIVEPSEKELCSPGTLDTSGELGNTVSTGLQHKYRQTALILVTNRCFSYCRYCFRRRVVAGMTEEVATDYRQIAQYIQQHTEINNVLLSGGDPFVLSNRELHRILDYLLPIPHISTIRIGTKGIAYSPSRFADRELDRLFKRVIEAGKTPVIISHFDHFAEISNAARQNIERLNAMGVQFLNQTVLLADVNDEAKVLATTFQQLHSARVRPYYLFQSRPVKGASHFQVPLRRGVRIVQQVNRMLSGIQKTFRYIMSHRTGKIEILDVSSDNRLYLRYHQNPHVEQIGRVFSVPYVEGTCWLEEVTIDE